MTSVVLLQIGLALVIAATPWFVVKRSRAGRSSKTRVSK